MSDASFPSEFTGRRRRWGVVFGVVVALLAAVGAALCWWWFRPVDWDAVYAQNNRGISVMEAFHYKEATSEFERVVQRAPDWLPGRINLGIALLNASSSQADLIPRCKATFEEVLRRDEDNANAHFCLGILLMYQKDGDEARKHFQAVLKTQPDDAYTLYWLGTLEVRKPEEQAVLFREALKRNKHLSGAIYGMALSLRQTDPEAAQKMFDESEALRRADWSNATGIKYSQMGPLAEAIGRIGDQPTAPPTGPLPLFQRQDNLKVRLIEGARWAKAADLGDDATGEVRRLVRKRFGSTMVVLDYNRDGKPDLFLAGAVMEKGRVRDLLLRNDGEGSFTDVTAQAGLATPRPTLGCCVGNFDNDAGNYPDLLITGVGVQKMFRNKGDGTFEDVSAAASLDKLTSVCLGAACVDLDQDSDLDAILCEYAANAEDALKRLKGENVKNGGGLAVFLHVGSPTEIRQPTDKPPTLECKFQKSDIAELQGAAGPAVTLALSDVDGDRDLDLLSLEDRAAPALILNDRLLHFHRLPLPEKKYPSALWNGALALDVDHDGRSDFLMLSAGDRPQVFVNRCKSPTLAMDDWFELAATNAPPLRQAVAIDLNLDSWTDAVGLSRDGVPVLLHNDGGRLVFQPEALGRDADWPKDLVALAVAVDGTDYRPDLFVWSESEGVQRYKNGGNGGQAVLVELLGRNSIDEMNRLRCNADGIGTWVVALSGNVWSGQEYTTLSAGLGQSRQPLLFGIARQSGIEALRMRWPDGTLQGEPDINNPALDLRAGKLAQILQRNRMPGSCPVLFSWDGRRFVFVNDFLGAGSLGEQSADGTCRPPRSEESIKIEAEQLKTRDGQYVLKIAEPMDETTYLDSLQLVVVDQPPEVRVYPDERFVTSGPSASQRLVAFDKEIFPVAARDHRGCDVAEKLRRWDRVTVDEFAKRPWLGFAEEHVIELDFGNRLASYGPNERLFLCLAGWTAYPYPESSWAAHQAGVHEQWPILERQDDAGGWHSLGEPGFPAGLPRMMLVELTGKLTGSRCRLRLRTNMSVYWDQAFVAANCRIVTPGDAAPHSPRATCLEVHEATLAAGRIPGERSPDGRAPALYDFDHPESVLLVRQSGFLTRFGDVTELLHRRDDRFVIFAPGDDLTVRFDATSLPPLPNGWRRSFVLRTAGYCKDNALSTAHGMTVEPLPFMNMRNYPYGADERAPRDAAHLDYLRRFLTREVRAEPSFRRADR